MHDNDKRKGHSDKVRQWFKFGNNNKQVARMPRHMHKFFFYEHWWICLMVVVVVASRW